MICLKTETEKRTLAKKHVQRVTPIMKQVLGDVFQTSYLGKLRKWSKPDIDGGCCEWLRLKRHSKGEVMTDDNEEPMTDTAGHFSMVHMHKFLSLNRKEYDIDGECRELWKGVQANTMKSLKAEVNTEFQLREEERATEVIPLFLMAGYMQSEYVQKNMDIMSKHFLIKEKNPVRHSTKMYTALQFGHWHELCNF